MKSSRRTVSIALRSRSERRSPRRLSSSIFASRSRRRSSSLLTGWLGGGMSHPSFIGRSDLRRPGAPRLLRCPIVRRAPRASLRAFIKRHAATVSTIATPPMRDLRKRPAPHSRRPCVVQGGCSFEVVRHASFSGRAQAALRASVDACGASGPLAFAQQVFLDLAGGGFGQLAERDGGGGLEVGEVVAAEVDDLLLACLLPCAERDESL